MTEGDIKDYWERRYAEGGTSGAGSEGDAALAKGRFINEFIRERTIASVIDWGVGDGEVLSHITPGVGYTGIDISTTVIERLRHAYAANGITLLDLKQAHHIRPRAELAISSDVLFHQIDLADHHAHLNDVFTSATTFVLIHSTDYDGGLTAPHVARRSFTPDVRSMFPQWALLEMPEDPMTPGWYFYEKKGVPT